ncbi:MAG TPA: energy-coupling factor transporter transmembrane protein EcfT [Chloroflexi bacterium]|jgi:energy-coupling factor transport system permease protein|nr:energy-coupling factor transporter transmembrane protein EcfT [Chloroflexota bacterium]
MRNTLSWVIWAGCAAIPALMIRNPIYTAIIALAAGLALVVIEREDAGAAMGWRGLLRLGAVIGLIAVPFNALMVHQGRHVLFRLPLSWPLVGGDITLEAIVAGLASAFSLWTVLLIFAAFNLAVDASQLVRLVPPFLHQAGVVSSIALTFVPQLIVSARDIREAQRIRGHRFRGRRDMLPLIVPLLTMALERAIGLAESMESRGFGDGTAEGHRHRGVLLSGLLLTGLALRMYWAQRPLWGIVMLAAGGVLVAGTFYAQGRGVRRTRYRRERWEGDDTVIVLCGAVALAGVLVTRVLDAMALAYYPYPPYSMMPAFRPSVGLSLLLLAAPALLAWKRTRHVARADMGRRS